jgi:cytochrome c2
LSSILLPLVIVEFFFVSLSAGGVSEGRKIFEALKCTSCHQTEGPTREKTIEEVFNKKGPELWYAGSKFQEGFLNEWLKNPEPIRPMAYYSLTENNPEDHPRLTATEAAEVTAYLMSLKSKDVKEGLIKPKKTVSGRIVFAKKLGCYGCHQYRTGTKVIGGLFGPTLVGAGNRLKADWIYAYLKTPGAFKTVRAMPEYDGIVSEKDLQDVAGFVAGFK